MSNPFDPPTDASAPPQPPPPPTFWPAMVLMAVTAVWMVLLALSLVLNLVFSMAGAPSGNGDVIQGALSLALLFVNGLILYGANEMRTQGNTGAARVACVLACIPCVSPCYLFGIPIGIWGLAVLLSDRR